MGALTTGWILGFVLGLRHALEPDHLAAVSTLVADGPRPRRAALIGALWGLGHAGALVLAGGLLLLLRLDLPDRAAGVLELGVAAMLVVLGVQSVARARREGRAGWAPPHAHGDARHEHPGAPRHVHVGPWALARRPLFVGLVHGLAGSGALATLALASMPSVGAGLGYVVVFGLGSIAGMALMTGAVGLPLGRIARGGRARAAVLSIAGLVSIGMGLSWAQSILGRL